MKVILLAAGFGTRLRPLTNDIPKCLVSINGKSLLEHWFDLLNPPENFDVLINTHYFADKVRSHVENLNPPHQWTLSYEEKLLGTAGTLRANKDFVGNESVMLVHADNLSRFNINLFIDAHSRRPQEAEMTMMLFETDRPSDCGVVEINQQGLVVDFFEKVKDPPSSLANGAVYIVEPTVIDRLTANNEITDFSTDVIPGMLGKIFTFFNGDYHRDIGTTASLALARKEFGDTS